jgi:hypothetical protein
MSADLDKSVERLVAAEGRTAYSVGHSLTRQGQALTAKYLPALIRLIEAEKAGRRVAFDTADFLAGVPCVSAVTRG